MSSICPATRFSPASGSAIAMRIFSGRSASHTVAPNSHSTAWALAIRAPAALSMSDPAGPVATSRPSMTFTSPTNPATYREIGCS